jgi:hypothetical protein
MSEHKKIRIRYHSKYELKMRSRNSKKIIRFFQVGRETKRCVTLYVLVTTNYTYTFEYYIKKHKILGHFTNVKPSSCVKSYFLCIVCLFVTLQIVLDFICHDSWYMINVTHKFFSMYLLHDTRHGHQHRVTVTGGCIDTICLS